MREGFVGFVVAAVMYGVVLAFWPMRHAHGGWPIETELGIVGVVGAAGLSIVAALHRRPLDAASATALAQTYRTNFFLKIAFNNVVTLLAFVLSFVAASRLVYPLGLAFALVGFWIAAPGRRDVRRRTDQLRGTGLDLLVALRDVPAAPR